MNDQDRIDDRLARDIGYALSRSSLRPKSHIAIDTCTLAAGGVVKHLRLCGWRFEKGPGAPAHGSTAGRGRPRKPWTRAANKAKWARPRSGADATS